jgi:flagellar hook-length control protein FliK
VIQVSSPTQGPGSPQETGYHKESGNVESLSADFSVFKGAQKKNRQGVFAKLLQGLSVKLTKGEAASNSSPNSNSAEFPGFSEIEEPGQNSRGKTVKKTASLAKDAKKPPFGMEALNGEGLGEFLGVPERENGVELTETKAGNPRFSERLLDEINQKDDLLNFNFRLPDAAGQGKAGSGPDLPDLANGQSQPAATARNKRNISPLNDLLRETEADSAKNQSRQGPLAASFGAEKENAPFQETRGRKSRERSNLEVRDLRTGEGQKGALAPAENAVSLKEAVESNLQPLSKAEIEIPVELDLHRGSAEVKASDSAAGRTFEDALAAQLRGNLSSDIVRDAAIIVRNGGEGTIRLSLRPASLGDVKIRLELTENKISGHIIVESGEALRAFERELPVLEKAFRDSGFSETNLEMFLASENSRGGGAFDGREDRQERDFLIQSIAASRYETESDQSALGWLDVPIHDEGVLFVSPGRTPVNLLV